MFAVQKNQKAQKYPAEDNLGFGQYFSPHMFEARFHLTKGWVEPKIKPYENISLDPAASVLHYGQALFEGMKAFHGVDGKIRLFRPEKNYERLTNGAARLCMVAPPLEFFIEGARELIKIDKSWVPKPRGTALYIRPTLIGTGAFLGVRPADEFLFYIITSPVGAYYGVGHETVSIWIETRYSRAARGGVGATKSGGNYAASLLAAKKAKDLGYSQVLWLDSALKKNIEEVGTMNVFFLIGDELVTPPLGGSILPGVTRDSVLGLAKSMGLNVVEKNISLTDLQEAFAKGQLKEAFGTGTAATISPIGRFGMSDGQMVINDEKCGPVAKELLKRLGQIYYGEVQHDWAMIVE